MYTHKGCGGKIAHRKCSKCGQTWTRVKWFTAKDINFVNEEAFSPKKVRDRIRSGRDISTEQFYEDK